MFANAVSDEKRAQERQRLLVNELNHRVKNTLATVQSIAWQTFKGTDAETFERFSGRLTTLSRAHNVLTETAWARASLRFIADAAVDTVAEVDAIAISSLRSRGSSCAPQLILLIAGGELCRAHLAHRRRR